MISPSPSSIKTADRVAGNHRSLCRRCGLPDTGGRKQCAVRVRSKPTV